MKSVQYVATAMIWACIGTVALEGAGASVLWLNGRLNLKKIKEMAAVVYGVDPHSIQQHVQQMDPSDDSEQPSYQDIVALRSLVHLNLDLREIAVDKAHVDNQFLQSQLDQKKKEYFRLRKRFDEEQEDLEDAAKDEALLEVQRTLVSLPAKQAKGLILRMLDDDVASHDDRAMNDLVTIIKSMPIDHRKKIIGEFKTDAEQRQLGDILQKIRLGIPNVELIRKTRQQLRQFHPQRGKGSNDGVNPV